ncbi:unnamed protein product [Clavelina lepadiformis]|uniref:Uncharacterized protein n=1 Tax=Clavelina lepadiformis TaxID=159417 RepID=A0ABP0EZY7_CLALP
MVRGVLVNLEVIEIERRLLKENSSITPLCLKREMFRHCWSVNKCGDNLRYTIGIIPLQNIEGLTSSIICHNPPEESERFPGKIVPKDPTMVIGRLALTILWILGAVISGQELSGAELLDPMANLLPVSVSATQSQTRDDEKPQPSDFDINQTPTHKEESSEILSTSVTSSVSSGPPGRLSIEQDRIKLSGTTSQSANHERQRGSDQSHGQCSYTFIVPQNPALCMNSQTSVTSQSDDRFLVEVQRDGNDR